MSPKKVPGKVTAPKKMMSMELKREIIEKNEQGVRVTDLARQYGRSTSTICTVLKQKETIKNITTAKGVKIISRLRSSLHEKMERLLMLWMKEKQLKGETLTQTIICEKARAIYDDLRSQTPRTSQESERTFKVSRGWFDNFKKRSGIHGEVGSSDVKIAVDYVETFSEMIVANGYIPQQVFNCDETELFWKRMPRRTYITEDETKMPGHKPMKDKLTVGLCANASGDCKIKPLLVYHSENPRAFKSHKIDKDKLDVMWRVHPKTWVTTTIFVEWLNLVFGPSVKKYLLDNNLPMRVLLVLDNAPGHPPNVDNDILDEFKFIKVLYLPSAITRMLQPMEQDVICNFKKLYTKCLLWRCLSVTDNTNMTLREYWKDHFNIVISIKIIAEAWLSVTTRTLNSAWVKLWPDFVVECFDDFEPVSVDEEIISLGTSLGLMIDERDVNELVEDHSQELTTDELEELQENSQVFSRDIFKEDPNMDEVVSTSEIEDILAMWKRVSQFVEKKHPEKVATSHVSQLFDDTALAYFRSILSERKRKTSDGFLVNPTKKARVKKEKE